jgi:hypothetical protein
MSAVPITISGDVASVRFSSFNLTEYGHFLELKKKLPAPELDLSYDWAKDVYTIQFPVRYAAQLGHCMQRPLVDVLAMSDGMWDYQQFFTKLAFKHKRFAFFWDCGLGKTRAFLEFARQAMNATGKKALIVSIAGNLITQTIKQCQRFYGDSLPIVRLETREHLIEWLKEPAQQIGWTRRPCAKHQVRFQLECVDCLRMPSEMFPCPGLAIVNYEKFIPGQIPELRALGCLVLDESSILKTGGGKIKWNIIHSAKGIEYKLSNTATPAPNEAMEYASQAAFLETIRHEGDVIWTYFKKNDDGSWRLIKHAEKAFYTFLASWSVFMRSPASYWFKDNVQPVPQPEYLIHEISATTRQMEEAQRYRFEIGAGLLGDQRMGVKERLKLSQIAKGFVYQKLTAEALRRGENRARRIPSLKPEFIAGIALDEFKRGNQAVTWTVFDEEGEIIAEEFERRGIPYRLLTGKTPMKLREKYIEEFNDGFPHIISNAEMLGYGMNLEFGAAEIFSGWNDSFEQWYQAIRRMVRYGQTKRVRVHVAMIEGLEDAQLENVQAKAKAYEEQAGLQEQAYREAIAWSGRKDGGLIAKNDLCR